VLVVEGRTVAAGSFAARWVTEQVDRADQQLTHACEAVEAALHAVPNPAGTPADDRTPSRPEGVSADDAATSRSDGGTGVSEPVATGLSSAIGLLGLLGADYSITSAPVTTTTSRLAVLTAGILAASGVAVELSDFGQLAGTSPAVTAAVDAMRRLDAVGHVVARADATLAPRRAEVARLRAELAVLEDAWKAAVAGKPEESAARLAVIEPALTAARGRLATEDGAIAPRETTLAGAKESLANASQILTSLVTPGTDGTVPLRTAVLYERLAGVGELPFTHVLLVSADGAGSDTVTRRVLLGESGRVSFLGGVNNTWALLEVSSHTVVAAGPASIAQRMTFDLGSGESSIQKVIFGAQSSDPFDKVVTWSRYLVGALCVFLVLIGAAQVIDSIW
jgi:hypothetical protein